VSTGDDTPEPNPRTSGITQHDVARLAGVSAKTVSRVLNGARYVREDKRLKVQAAIDQLNYRPNMAARVLAGSKSYLLGLLLPTGARNYVDQLIRGALTHCQQTGYHVVVEFYDVFREDLVARVETLCARATMDGAILGPGLCDSPAVTELLERLSIPHVSISPREPLPSPYVYIDDVRAGYEMTRHLLGLGHTEIAFIGAWPGWRFAERRLQGYQQAMDEAGVTVRPDLILNGDFSFRSGQERAQELLARSPRPTALFAVNDDTAMGAMTAAYRCGLTIPGDISIAGFDDTPAAEITWPQLTTVRQPVEQMAAVAAQRLMQDQPDAARDSSPAILIPFEIVVRGTTGPPPAA
jgi:LacI family transcriptional regulator